MRNILENAFKAEFTLSDEVHTLQYDRPSEIPVFYRYRHATPVELPASSMCGSRSGIRPPSDICPLIKVWSYGYWLLVTVRILLLRLASIGEQSVVILQILPTEAFLFFFGTDSSDSPDCLPILLSISVFLLFSFSVFHFLVVGSVQ